MSFTFPYICLETVDSTNTYLKNHPETWTVPYYTVRAKEQTSGRGRYGRSWISGRDNLAFSFTFRPPSTSRLSAVTIYAGLALRSILHKICGQKLLIKWPNDIIFEGKKLAGILTEMVENGNANIIIGIGLNLHDNMIPREWANTVTSLKQISNKDYEATELLNQIMNEMREYLSGFTVPLPEKIIIEFTTYMDRAANLVSIMENGKIIKKKYPLSGINQYGQLVTEDPSGSPKIIDVYEVGYPE
ncbi:MAG: biotin--[acetyl-CoA-carboxylase] ligase [Spirochaetia bacterium]|nr:biotin--[acetyl-CoA-carboxylase] ligase [Spirochaetia bacterium]